MPRTTPTKRQPPSKKFIDEDPFDFDFENDISIDEDALDDEWLVQANLFWKYSQALVFARKELRDLHEEVKVTRSKIVKELKSDNKKITGPEIEAGYRTDQRHIDAKEAMIEAEFKVDLLEVALNSIREKRYAISDLVKIKLGEMYGDPKDIRLPNGGKFAEELKRRKVRRTIYERLNKKK